MGLLNGRNAIVTGGGSGIGRATCARMAEEGARVTVLDIDAKAASTVADEIGGLSVAADVTNPRALAAAIEDAAYTMGGLHVMFNNAGAGMLSPLHDYPFEEWDRLVRLNLSAVFYGMRTAIPLMRPSGGAIVNMSSVSGTRPAAGEAPYSASKAGVIALTRSAAIENGPAIRVNAVSPGWIRTGLTAPLEQFPDVVEGIVHKTPMARVGDPEDVADVVTFLCSDRARFITGQNIVVDGGMTLHGGAVDGMLDYLLALSEPPPPQ
ncbi:MAG: SDR family NAD(P)-dependent oxidoreductase [Actinomycetota bacterium]